MKRRILPIRWQAAAAAALLVAACGSGPSLDRNLGGATTRLDASQNSFGLPAPTLTNEERRAFEVGDSFFTQNWVIAPASTDARDGLGPTFNAHACSSCHIRDGRGLPPFPTVDGVLPEVSRLGLLVRLKLPERDLLTGEQLGDPNYSGQLQDRAILGVEPEGTLSVSYRTVRGAYGDGAPYELRAPTYSLLDLAFGALHPDVTVGPRLAPQIIGMGLLEAIPEASLLAAADPDDTDGDGISGRPNWVWDAASQRQVLGRFGWKANIASIGAQVTGAFIGDIGITSDAHPDENCPSPQTACAAAQNGGSPELPANRLSPVVLYARTLSVPAMRDFEDPDVRAGSEAFDDLGCVSCHIRRHRTGPSDIATLADQVIYPYTDLLLHEMGEGLADGQGDFEAGGSEWRTPPLWGIGLIEAVNGERFLLHDGRARTLEEAILWHGGEAEAAKEAFRLSPAEVRRKLIAFLEAL